MLLTIISSVFINTNKQRALLSTRSALAGDSDTPAVITSDVDGIATPERNSIFGYDLLIENRTFWSESIYGAYICAGDTYEGIHFSSQPDYNSDSDFDIKGFVVVFIIAVLMFCVVTAQWPALLNILSLTSKTNDKVDLVLRNLNMQHDNGEDIDADKKCACLASSKFARWWMLLAALCLLAIAAMASQMLCQSLKFPNIVKYKRVGKCWFVDTSTMGTNTSSGRRLLADAKDGDVAQVQKKSDGSVTFYSQCGTAYWQSDESDTGGAIWTVEPPTIVKCTPVNAIRISQIQAYMQSKCTLGSWTEMAGPKINPPANYKRLTAFTGRNMSSSSGFSAFTVDSAVLALISTLETDGDSWYSGLKCGFLNLGNSWRKGEANVIYTNMDNWSFCQAVPNDAIQEEYYKGKGLLRRSDGEDQEDIEVDEYTIDDNIANARPYGWYTNGVSEIIVTSTFSKGRKSSVAFEEFATEDGIKQIALDMLSIQRDNWKFTSLQDVNTNPNSFSCRQSFKMDTEKASRFKEFQTNCTTAQAILNEKGIVTISASSEESTTCMIEVGYQSTADPQQITPTQVSMTKNTPKQFNGVTHWNCMPGYTEGQGISCGKTELVEIGLNITSSITSSRTSNPTYTRENNYDLSGFGIDFGPLSNGIQSSVGAITNTLTSMFGGVGVSLVVIGVIALVAYLIFTGRLGCCRDKQTVEIQQQPPPQIHMPAMQFPQMSYMPNNYPNEPANK